MGDGTPDLFGRSAELDLLVRAVAGGASDLPAHLLLAGPPGIGKSALLDALAGQDACRRATTLRAVCRRQDAGRSFALVQALFAPVVDGADGVGDPVFAGAASWAAPVLGTGGRAVPASASPAVLRGLYWFTAGLAARGPLVLLVDDLQWCDDASRSWLGHLLRRIEGLPVRVVTAARTDAAGRPAGGPAEEPATLVVPVGPLDGVATGELATRLLRRPVAPSLVAALVEGSSGSPLLIERLAAEVAAGPHPVDDEAAARRVRERGREVITELVTARVLRASPAVRAVAIAVAVLGAEEVDVLAGVAGLDPDAVGEALATLRGDDLFVRRDVDYRHDVLRAAVLGRLGDAELDRVRRRAATVLDDAGRPAEVVAAAVLELAGDPDPWMVGVLEEAAAAAGRRGAPSEVVRYLSVAHGAAPDDVRLRRDLAAALLNTRPDRALTLLEETLRLPLRRADRLEVTTQLAMCSLVVQDAPRAVAEVTGLLDVLDEDPPSGTAPPPPGAGAPDREGTDPEARTRLEATLLVVGLDEKRTVAATCERAARMTVPPGDTPAERQKLAMLAVVAAMQGRDARRAAAMVTRVLQADDPALGGWALLASSLVLRLTDELAAGDALLDRLVEHSRSEGAAWTYCLAIGTRADNRIAGGRVLAAEDDAQNALEVAEQESWRGNTIRPALVLAHVRVLRGRAAEALELLATVSRPRMADFAWEYHQFLGVRAEALAAIGDHDGAIALAQHCGRSLTEAGITNPVFLPWWALAAELLAGRGRVSEAVEAVERGEELAAGWGTARSRGLALRARATVAAPDRRVELLAEATEVLDGSPARLEAARARLGLGAALLDGGFRDDARGHLRSAARLAGRCGDLPTAGRARDLLVDAGGRMPTLTGSPLDVLSGAERRVALLVADGLRNRDVAEALFVTVRTVELHLTSAYRKLAVSDRAGLRAVIGTPSAP